MTPKEFSQTVHTLKNICEEAEELLTQGYVIGVNNLNVLEFDKMGSRLRDMVENLEDLKRKKEDAVFDNVR